MDFLDAKTLWVIAHLLGVVLGAGGAYASDFMFFSSVKDGRITTTELRFLRIGSTMVWLGVIAVVVSGLGLFSLDPEGYLASSKFLAKMSIVAVIIFNGLIFHWLHLPLIERHCNTPLSSSKEFTRRRPFLLLSGAVSFVSWTSALILGALSSVPYSVGAIISVYALALIIGSVVVLFIFKRH